MPKYLFTSDLRISTLLEKIQNTASWVVAGNRISDIIDKSENNNATTLAFYFNLYEHTVTCEVAALNPIDVIRNYVLKFQFPNTRTRESYNDSINEKTLFAPYRSVVRVLYRMSEHNDTGVGKITLDEILYFLFCNKEIFTNPNFDVDKVIENINQSRRESHDIKSRIASVIEWNQYSRQVREMMTVLTKAFPCFILSKNTLVFSKNSSQYLENREAINGLVDYHLMWYPSDKNNFNKAEKEYISYMDMKDVAYSVIDYSFTHKVKSKQYQDSLQQIFYGAPGTGKSHEIKEKTKDQSVIRTTFHPDSDYSTFVGCYKPTMMDKEDNLTMVELTAKLKEIAMAVPPVSYPCLNFATRYWKSLLKLTPKERENIIVACGFGTSYTAEVNKGMSIGPELAGYFKNESIVYRFVKQAFLKAYLMAWKNYTDGMTATSIPVATSTAKGDDEERELINNAIRNSLNPYNNTDPEENTNQTNPDEHNTTNTKLVATHSCKPVFLIIEEINRGNCAQIFGDLFQLLDRGENGFSEYPIEADTDLQQEIARAFKEDKEYRLIGDINVEGMVKGYTSTREGGTLSKDIQDGHILLLPKNLYIWATMNTSDQSLFPIDSAFKRRWDWTYMKIKNHPEENYKIKLSDKEYDWWEFIQRINEIIASMTSSADKQLGYFFCKAAGDGTISPETFVSKVIFYLWNDVFKDYGFEDASLFQYMETVDGKEVTKDLTFPDFYDEAGKRVNETRLKDFLDKVLNWKKDDNNNER